MNKEKLWKLCCGSVILLIIITFTPLIIPHEVHHPYFSGMPYTLWVGILLSLVFLAFTVLGSFVHPGRDSDKNQPNNG